MNLPEDFPAMPPAWRNLIDALALLARGQCNDISPLNCTHDTLGVSADPEKFTPEEIAQLEAWGFHVDPEGGFYSFRYGSA